MRKSSTRFMMTTFLVLGLAVACTNGPCRQMKNPELANRQVPAQANAADVGSAAGQRTILPGLAKSGGSLTDGASKTKDSARDTTVLVYKADGSLQCGQGKAVAPTEMEKQLSGIQVYSRDNRDDGMMHIQMCGSPTGKINVYEIPASALSDALKRGFKKLES